MIHIITITVFILVFSLITSKVFANPYLNLSLNPQQIVFKSFLHCDAHWLTVLTQQAENLPEIQPILIEGAGGASYISVPNRRSFYSKDQTRQLITPFKVKDVLFTEFIDEIVPLVNASSSMVNPAQNTGVFFEYYWGFKTKNKLTQVLPIIQQLLSKENQLTPNFKQDTWIRMEEFKENTWKKVAQRGLHNAERLPERSLIVQENESGGTSVLCGLQTAPLPSIELDRLRPDLRIP